MSKRKKICFVTTISLTMRSFVIETAKYLHDKMGWDITLICGPDADFSASLPEHVHYIPVNMARGIDFSAYKSVLEFIRIFKQEKFDLVQYSTPNAACYASIAARITKVPIRLYAQWGMRYTGMTGLSRRFFRSIEKLVCQNSTHVRSVSPLNMAFGISEKLYPPEKVAVVGHGGTIGVNLDDYDITQKAIWRAEVRAVHHIEKNDFVFGFAGRVSADKGCGEMFQAFQEIAQTNVNAKLLVVGPVEENCGIDAVLLRWTQESEQVVFTGRVNNSEMKRYYASMDVLVHPSYREGFGMVIQEAGALAIPVITTKIPGASEVMVNGESCLLVEPQNPEDLTCAMRLLCREQELATQLGRSAYERTKKLYARPIMLENQRLDYTTLLF